MGILWAIVWFFGLWFIGWPVAGILVWVYILLLPFSACVDPLKEIEESLLKLVQLPIFFTEKMIAMEAIGG